MVITNTFGEGCVVLAFLQSPTGEGKLKVGAVGSVVCLLSCN